MNPARLTIPPSIPADAALLHGAVELLGTIEELPSDATGVLGFGSYGKVLVESRSICWAVALGMEQRLTELLRHQRNPPLPREFVDDLFRECKRTGRHLGETLLASGEISEAGLRTALFRHTTEAIAHIARSGAKCEGFVPHAQAGYDARFVFTPPEVLASIGGRCDRALAAAARVHLDVRLVPDSQGLAFIRDARMSTPVIVAVGAQTDLRVAHLLDLASWASSLFDVADLFDPGVRFVTGTWRSSNAVVAWRDGETYYAARCASRAAATILAARLDEARSPT
ncbi:MAG: hypothetical protein H6719_18800 [Sandaracinaceae bacterium]|nr:hypothetical protein [Sandaracinaceae bacterium]